MFAQYSGAKINVQNKISSIRGSISIRKYFFKKTLILAFEE